MCHETKSAATTMCLVGATPDLSVVIAPCTNGINKGAASCMCEVIKVTKTNDHCNTKDKIMTPLCVGDSLLCTGTEADCIVASTGCVCKEIVAVSGQTCVKVGTLADQILKC